MSKCFKHISNADDKLEILKNSKALIKNDSSISKNDSLVQAAEQLLDQYKEQEQQVIQYVIDSNKPVEITNPDELVAQVEANTQLVETKAPAENSELQSNKETVNSTGNFARRKPKNELVFTNPITGENGNQVLSYRWSWKEGEKFDTHDGGLLNTRVSDWDSAIINPETGKEIVHQFNVKLANGEEKIVSLETAKKLIGDKDILKKVSSEMKQEWHRSIKELINSIKSHKSKDINGKLAWSKYVDSNTKSAYLNVLNELKKLNINPSDAQLARMIGKFNSDSDLLNSVRDLENFIELNEETQSSNDKIDHTDTKQIRKDLDAAIARMSERAKTSETAKKGRDNLIDIAANMDKGMNYDDAFFAVHNETPSDSLKSLISDIGKGIAGSHLTKNNGSLRDIDNKKYSPETETGKRIEAIIKASQSSNDQANNDGQILSQSDTFDPLKIKNTQTQPNTKGGFKLIDTDTGREVFEGRSFKTKSEGNKLLKKLQQEAINGPEKKVMFSKALPETITIDGKERSTTNSNGKPIAQTEEGIKNFWNWFGDSKVVDDEGKPKVMVHASFANGMKEFKGDKGHWFAPISDTYEADLAVDSGKRIPNPYEGELIDAGEGATYYPTYLAVNNPVTDDNLSNAFYDGKKSPKALIKMGFDGVLWDDGVTVALSPNQIKSAIGNTGKFSPKNKDILKSTETSKTDTKITGSTVEQVKNLLPRQASKLADKGIINIVQSIKDIPGSVEGFYETGPDKIYLIANSLNKKNIGSVLAHELFHRALIIDPKLKGRVDNFKDYFFNRYTQASKGLGSAIENMAYKRIINADTPMEDRAEEFMAYMVSEYMRNPNMLVLKMKRAIERFIGHVRAILIRSGLDLGLIKELTPADLSAMAMRYGTTIQGKGKAIGSSKYHTAWHGSPHDHSKFNSGKIGTGEGAQAFGYGHYFTDAKSIAEYYRDSLSSKIDLKLPDGLSVLDEAKTFYGKNTAKKILHIKSMGESRSGWKLDDIKKEIESYSDRSTGKPDLEYDINLLLDAVDNGIVELQKGKLYTVELAPEQDEYLDWDKPLSEQSEKIKEALKDPYSNNEIYLPEGMSLENTTGEKYYEWLSSGIPEDASITLHSLGIRGIRYKAEQGKSEANNYVIFSDDDISITEKYSVAMPAQITNVAEQGDAWLKGYLNQSNKDIVIYNLQDRFIDLKRQMERVVEDGGVINEKANPYLAEELYHQSRQSLIDDFYADEVQPVLNTMHDKGIGIKELEEFLHARHAPSRNAAMAEINPSQEIIDQKIEEAQDELDRLEEEGAKPKEIAAAERDLRKWQGAEAFYGTEEQRLSLSGMSDEAAADYMDSLEPERLEVLERLGDTMDAINNKTLDIMVDYGLETQETIDTWKRKWDHYVPLHRDEAHPENGNFGHPVGKGFSVSGNGMQQATGSNADVTNIMAHIMAAREQMISRGEKNKVSIALAEFIKEHPDKDFAEVNKLETHKKLVDGLVEDVRDPFFVQKEKRNVVTYRENGKDRLIVFNEKHPENIRLALSLKNMDGVELDKVESIIGKGTRWLASVNTQYNLVFGIFNLMRDTQGMALNLESTALHGKQKQVLGLMPKAIKTIFNITRGGDADPRIANLYDDFRHDGGTTGFVQMFDTIEKRSQSLQKELDLMGAGKASKSWHFIVKAIEDFNTIMENGTRFATYMAGRDAGLTRMESASLSKNITVNFNRKGAYTTKLGAFYAFFNASMQGTFRTVETLSSDKGKQIMAGGVALGAITTLLGLAAMGDDEWEKIPEFVRERSLIIPTGKKSYVAIPMPLGFHLLPNIGRKFVESFLGSDRVTPQQRLLALAGSMVGAFNPLGGSDISGAIMPTVMDPALALWRNKDWTGKPVYREDFNSLKPTPGFTRTKDSATWGSKATAELINKATGGTDARQGLWSPTPDQIDYLVGQIAGGTGREIMKAEQVVESAFTGEELPTYKIPLVGRLIGSTGDGAVEATAYYDNLKRLNEHEAEIKYLKENGNARAVISYTQDNPEVKILGFAANVEKTIDRMKKQRRVLISRGGSSKAIDQAINAQMKKLNDKLLTK